MKEEEIRKRAAFDKYLQMVEEETRDFFDFKSFIRIDCPACGSREFIDEFQKTGFKYVSCKDCLTLFANPRPSFAALRDFYTRSRSTAFFINQFFKPVAEARREKIFRPRAEYISERLKPGQGLVIGDIGAGFGLFLEELRKISPGNRYLGIEPSSEMAAICRDKGLEVKEACLEDIEDMEGAFDLLASFELFEHLCQPEVFFKKIYSLLKEGGDLFLTTLNGQGFDISLLWEKSKSVFPPHHLNFFNPVSIKRLLEKSGFKLLEISTPGKLDWDITEGMIRSEGLDLGRFWNLFAKQGRVEAKEQLQEWISNNGLSSHMRVLARKR